MKEVFDREIVALKEQMLSLPWERPEFYASYLTQTYYFVRHSTRLLALAAGHAGLSEDSLHRRYSAHIGEEKGHDRMALGDLKRLGVTDLDEELAATRNLYEGQYYKTEKLHPSVLFGYILALEGVASLVCPLFIQRIYDAHGAECATFLKLHVEEDPDHVEKAFAEIEALPENLKKMVRDNLVQSFRNYSAFLAEALLQSRRSGLVIAKKSVSSGSEIPATQR